MVVPIFEADLPTRVANELWRQGFGTLEHVVDLGVRTVATIHGIGPVAVLELESAIERHGVVPFRGGRREVSAYTRRIWDQHLKDLGYDESDEELGRS